MENEIYNLFISLGFDPYYAGSFLCFLLSFYFIRKMKREWSEISLSEKDFAITVIIANILILFICILRLLGIAKF
jgi:hypothetical protein